MLRENDGAGLLSNSAGSKLSTGRAILAPQLPPNPGRGCDERSSGRKRPRSPTRTGSTLSRRKDWNSTIEESPTCPRCHNVLPILRDEIASLKRQLAKANARLKELEGKWGGCHRDTEGSVRILKSKIQYLMCCGKVTKEQVMTGKISRKLLGNGAECSILQLALSDVQEEIRLEEQQCRIEIETKAMENHDRKQLTVLKSVPESNPEDVVKETTRQLVECYEQTWQSYAENCSENLEVKPIYMSVRQIISESHARLMECPGYKVRELLDDTAKITDDGLGPKPSEGRQLLINKFMEVEPPNEQLATDMFDSPIENDIRMIVRAAASFHILSLPGSDCKMIKSDAALFWEFGSYLFNSDGNLELVDSIKEMKDIVRTRKGQLELIYSSKILDAILVYDELQTRPKKTQRLSKPQAKRKIREPQRWPPGAVRTTKMQAAKSGSR